MELNKLSEIMRKAGVVGAGGAGFPSYAKLNMAADTIILNCAECEPLLKLHRQVMQIYASEIMETLEEIANTLEASNVIIAIKPHYEEAVRAIRENLHKFKKIKIGFLPEIYPAGDELITIYETTGRVVNPGSLPISVGCIVYNVETIYNVYRACKEDVPVTHKYITIAGEVKVPCTLKVPLGITFGELIAMAGGETCKDTVIISGGPMTGIIGYKSDVVTKTSNAILVMPKEAYIVQKRLTPLTINVKRAMAACCQCRMCTDLCSRNLLGHPIEPHKVMQAAASGVVRDEKVFSGTFSCSSCGLCELYACGQELNPRSIIADIKDGLRAGGVTPPKGLVAKEVSETRQYRRVPMTRLISRLGLAKYDLEAPVVDVDITSRSVKIMLSQHIGAPASVCVKVGDSVKCGDILANVQDDKLGCAVHSSINGTVTEISDKYIVVQA